MLLNPDRISRRVKLILAGLYLAKFDSIGLRRLGFRNFAEAYNVIGYALGSQPASIKNYRDEFDPKFPNGRKGWHKRPIRDHCLQVFEVYQDLDLDLFAGLIKSFLEYDENRISELEDGWSKPDTAAGFVSRLVTGLAAEQYFELVHAKIPEFGGMTLENTTRLGCGYDFRLRSSKSDDFFAVEVKGLREPTGSLSLTPKEFEVAREMRDRFYLFVVKNFKKDPTHEIFQNPISGRLAFTKTERILVQISWITRI